MISLAMGAIKSWAVSAELWKRVEPLIPQRKRAKKRKYLRVTPPILNEPILHFSVDPVKVDGFEICGVNIAAIGAIKGAAMGGQKGIGLFPGVELL